jgi:O-antigen/teichoic acid export membrane protein
MRSVRQEGYLQRDHLATGLKTAATRGAAVTLVGQWGGFVFQLVSTIVLARLLSPSDYGLVGMVGAITGFAYLIQGMGLSTATVQRKEITHEQISTLFWLNTGLGLLVAAVVAALAPVIAGFYGRPELTLITVALAGAFLMGGMSVQHQALLNRRMQFVWLSAIELASVVAGIAIAVVVAWRGGGYWALVAMNLTSAGVRLVMVWTACRWRPGRPVRASGVGSMVRFGANLSLFAILNYFSRNLDNVLIGKYWGAAQLGVYTKAYSLLLLPIQQINTPISRVAIPTLSYLQDDPDRYRRYYQTAINAISYLAMPLIVLMAVLSDEVVLLLLGEKWVAAAPIFRVLAFAGIAQTVAHTNGWIYTSTGHTGRQALWALFSRPLIVVSFAVGLPWGPYGVAVAYTVASYILLVPGFALAVRETPLKLSDVGRAAWRPTLLSAMLYLVATQIHRLVEDSGTVAAILVTGVGGVLLFGAAAVILPSTRLELARLLQMVRSGVRSPPAVPSTNASKPGAE